MKTAAMDPDRLAAFEELAAEASMNPGRMIAHAVAPGRMQVSLFIDGKQRETIVYDAGKRLRATMLAFDAGDLQEVLAGRAHQAKRADDAEAVIAGLRVGLEISQTEAAQLLAEHDQAEARKAAVIAVMMRMETTRALDHGDWARSGGCNDYADGGATRLTHALEELRVALGLPSEWRDEQPPEDPRVDPEVADDIRGQLEAGSFRWLGENPANSVDDEPGRGDG